MSFGTLIIGKLVLYQIFVEKFHKTWRIIDWINGLLSHLSCLSNSILARDGRLVGADLFGEASLCLSSYFR